MTAEIMDDALESLASGHLSKVRSLLGSKARKGESEREHSFRIAEGVCQQARELKRLLLIRKGLEAEA